jgi:hypothetical protein
VIHTEQEKIMAKKSREVSANNYLRLNDRLSSILLTIKEEAKRQSGREFGTHAARGSGTYERMLRESLDTAMVILNQYKKLTSEEADMIRRRLIKDYNYGFKMREQERQLQENRRDTPVMDQTKITKRLNAFEEMKKENIRRVTSKFLGWRDKNAKP